MADPVRTEAEYETGLAIAGLRDGHARALRAAPGIAKLWRMQGKQRKARAPPASVSTHPEEGQGTIY